VVKRIYNAILSDRTMLVVLVGLTMVLARRLGQEVDYDLRNYHFYNPYQLLEHRFERDLDAAGVQTYLNPVLDIPFYVAIRIWHIKPLFVGLAVGAFHGLNLWLVFKLARLLLTPRWGALAPVAAAAAALTGVFGAAFHLGIGATLGDNTLSVLILAALLILVADTARGQPPSPRSAALAGLLAGLAAGAKLTAAAYVLGLGAACLALGTVRQRLVRSLSLAAGAAVGFLATNGFWMWEMYRHFGSPLYPYLDAAFRSPFAPITQRLATQFKPRTLLQHFFYPFYFVTRQSLTHEHPFNDARLAVAFVSVVVLAAAIAWKRKAIRSAAERAGDMRLVIVLAFSVVSYIAWQQGFSIYRYTVSLELIAPVLMMAALAYLLPSPVTSINVALTGCLLLSVTAHPPVLYRIPWTPTYFDMDEAQLSNYAGATILMADMPSGYLAPFFPPSATFIRLFSNWPEMRARAEERIRNRDQRPIYLLDQFQAPPGDLEAHLGTFGLTIDSTRCWAMLSPTANFRICGLADSAATQSHGLSDAAAAPGPDRAAPPTYEGYNEVSGCDSLGGWAWDQANPDRPLDIDLYDGPRPFARVTANSYRYDLRDAHKGNGKHLFLVPTPSRLRDGRPHDISMRYAGTSTLLGQGTKQIVCAPGPARPEPGRNPFSSYEGYLDGAACDAIVGWAWDRDRPNVSLTIDLYDGARRVLQFGANVFRPDLVSAKKGNGVHGFRIAPPPELQDGNPHQIVVKFADTAMTIGTATTLKCARSGNPAPEHP
jgi:hypothetical protein